MMKKNSVSKILEEIYKAVCVVKFVVDDATTVLSHEYQRKLTQLFKKSPFDNLHLIGLEYYVAASVMKDAVQRREDVQDVVCAIQSECGRGLLSKDEVDEELRECCLNYSQTACLFAQLLAKAQMAA